MRLLPWLFYKQHCLPTHDLPPEFDMLRSRAFQKYMADGQRYQSCILAQIPLYDPE